MPVEEGLWLIDTPLNNQIIEIEMLKAHGVLVPVEPCEHGNYDPHFTGSDSWVGDEFQPVEKCEGAALKGDT